MKARWRSRVCSRRDSHCNVISLWQLPGTGIFGWNCCQKQPEVFLQFWQQWNIHGVVLVSPNSLSQRDILKKSFETVRTFHFKICNKIFYFCTQNSTLFLIFFPFWIRILNSSEFKNAGLRETCNKIFFQFSFTKYLEIPSVSVGPKLICYLFRTSS